MARYAEYSINESGAGAIMAGSKRELEGDQMTKFRTIALCGGISLALTACAQTGNAPTTQKSFSPALTGDPWFDDAQRHLAKRHDLASGPLRAKNVILFVADGMDPTTVAAARIFDGQSRGEEGEENLLSFETFPYVAFSKTYTTDFQVPDSAGTMSAMVTGVKTKSGIVSLNDNVVHNDCTSVAGAMVPTLGELAERAGMSVGVVSTAEMTHATPAAVYAHSPNRGWGVDSRMPQEAKDAGCPDIARQLIEFADGDGIDVALAGGRAHFLPKEITDPEDDSTGAREDGRDLTAEWVAKSDDHTFVWNKAGFDASSNSAKLLGLFEMSHLEYEADRLDDTGGEPSLTEMTEKAISMLSSNAEGFFLMVEAGRVDHAHHGGNAYRALTDAQEFAEAIAAAQGMTNASETLIVVTADHGHTMAIQGYPEKGNPILGLVSVPDEEGTSAPLPAYGDKKPYTTLSYANGPGTVFRSETGLVDGRPAPQAGEVLAKDYRQQALIPTGSETHGGQDVGIYATGPGAQLIGGVVEQNYIFHVIDYALELRQRAGE